MLAAPCALEMIASRCSSLVEIGAGGGEWARALRGRGVEVIAYDRHPAGPDVLRGDHTDAAKHGGAMLAVWPPTSGALRQWIDAAAWTWVFLVAHPKRIQLTLDGYEAVASAGLPAGSKGASVLTAYRRLPP